MRVLILDDNEDAADTLGTVISMHGFETAVAYSGHQAIELAQAFKPQALICDLVMPKMSGYEFCVQLRERTGRLPHIVIGYSGRAQDVSATALHADCFTHYFLKPGNLPDLLRVLTGITEETEEADASAERSLPLVGLS